MAEQTRSMRSTTNGQKTGQLARREGRWDPFAMFDELQQDMARFWNQPFGAWPMPRLLQRMPGPARWAPRMDVYERDNQLIIEAELPGIKKEDVQVELEGSDLVIHGESHEEHQVKQEDYYRTERSFGSFHRRLPLPFEVSPDQIQASMNNGVLEVRILRPAQAKTEAKRIQVK
jgi:HSP20 family protein